MSGLDMVRWGLTPENGAPPRLRFVKHALSGRDAALSEKHAPCCTEEEFPGFVWLKQDDGKLIKEKPDPGCPDHGLDATRYAAMFAWKRDLSHEEAAPMYDPGSVGELLNFEELLGDPY